MLDVIRFEPNQNLDWLVYRYPGDEFVSRSKLIVGPGQRAICVHMGQIEGEFKPGVTILSTETYPFLQRFVKAVNGGNAYPIEIYYVNTTINTKTIWGTNRPALVNDPQTTLLVHLRAHGSYIFRLRDAQFLLQMVLGNMASDGLITFDYIRSQFDDKVQEAVQYCLTNLVVEKHIPVLEIAAQTRMLSKLVLEDIDDFFRKYGFEITDFNTASISVPEEDMEAMKKRREYDVLGTSHVTERQLDISESWSKNEGTAGGVAVGMMGLGMGFNAMNNMGVNPAGMPVGGMYANQQQSQQQSNVKVICPKCKNQVDAKSKFCPECGYMFVATCPKCGAKVSPGSKFCPECGEKI